MTESFEIAPNTFEFPVLMPVPGYGLLNVNTYVIRGEQPVLIDTNAPIYRREFMEGVFSVIDPKDVRWVFLTHEDRDHSGSIPQVMEMCPNATLCVTFLELGKLSEEFTIDPHRVRLVADGETLDVGDRTLTAIRPPLYDAPTTRGLWDPTTRVYFSSDCFGATLPEGVQNVSDADPDRFEEGFFWMNSVNHVWHTVADAAKFNAQVDRIRALGARIVASGHGPVAVGRTDELLEMASRLPAMEPAKVPTHEEFVAMIAAAEQVADTAATGAEPGAGG